jgi:hypothetical protein
VNEPIVWATDSAAGKPPGIRDIAIPCEVLMDARCVSAHGCMLITLQGQVGSAKLARLSGLMPSGGIAL